MVKLARENPNRNHYGLYIAIGVVYLLISVPFAALAQKFDTSISKNEFVTKVDANKKTVPAGPENLDTKLRKIGLDQIAKAAGTKRTKYFSILNERNKAEAKRFKAQGGVDSGGGSLITRNGKTGLLDLYLYNKNLFFADEAGFKLFRTGGLKTFGIQRLDNSRSAVFENARAQVSKWAVSSPVIANMVMQSLRNLPLYYVDYQITVTTQQYYLPKATDVQPQELSTAAIYFNGIGAFISLMDFEKLSAPNQTALVIHEALRHAQITYQLGLSDDYIQRLTATVMSFGASPIMSLDEGGFIQGKILAHELTRIIISIRGPQVLKEACGFKASFNIAFSDTENKLCQNSNFEISLSLPAYKLLDLAEELRFFAANDFQNLSDAQAQQWASLSDDLLQLSADLVTSSVDLITTNVQDSVLALGKVTKSPLDQFIQDFNLRGFSASGSKIQAIELRNRLIQMGLLK